MDVRAALRAFDRNGLSGLKWEELDALEVMASSEQVRRMQPIATMLGGELHGVITVRTEIVHKVYAGGRIVEESRFRSVDAASWTVSGEAPTEAGL